MLCIAKLVKIILTTKSMVPLDLRPSDSMAKNQSVKNNSILVNPPPFAA